MILAGSRVAVIAGTAMAVVATFGLAACSTQADNAAVPPVTDSAATAPASETIPGFNLPQVMATAPDGSLLYVTQNDGSVIKVSTPKYANVGTWKSGITVPLGIAISPDGKTIYMSNRTVGSVSKFDAASGTSLGSWSTGSASAPTGIALSPDGSTIYVPQNASAGVGANALSVREASNGTLQQTWAFPSGSRPRAAAISADGMRAYVSLEGANRISVLDTSSGKELASWPLDKSEYSTPGYLALSKLGDLIYIAAASPSGVVVLNTKDGSLNQTWSIAKSAFGIAAADCGQTIFVSDWVDPGDVIAAEQPNQCGQQVPSAPQSVSATWNPKTKSITVVWSPPQSQGSSPITAFSATAIDKDTKTKTTYTCTATGTASSCTMANVKGGPTFGVTVTATNGAGTGPQSSPPATVKTG